MSSAKLTRGRIVWVKLPDSQGRNEKLRPAAIVTRDDNPAVGELLQVVGISARLPPDPIPADFVLLPWHPQGRVMTRLTQRCAAVCFWVADVPIAAVVKVVGFVPATVLEEIAAKLKRGGDKNINGTGLVPASD